jgi:hypothetical protein
MGIAIRVAGTWPLNLGDVIHDVRRARGSKYTLTSLEQADLLREVFGNPFRPASLDPGWRTPDVLGVAGGIYQERDFERLAVLGDALEEAGCADSALLDHCRSPAAHVRGCWLLDLCLGKD